MDTFNLIGEGFNLLDGVFVILAGLSLIRLFFAKNLKKAIIKQDIVLVAAVVIYFTLRYLLGYYG